MGRNGGACRGWRQARRASISAAPVFWEPILTLPTINSFWTGPAMDPIHAACLASYMKVGHPVRMFLYGKVDGLPPGVETASASELYPLP